MTDRQNLAAAAKAGGWHAVGNTPAGQDTWRKAEVGPDGKSGTVDAVFGDDGSLAEVWVDDRSFGDSQTVGLVAHAAAFLSGKPLKREGRDTSEVVWDEVTAGSPTGAPAEAPPAPPTRKRGSRAGRSA